MADDRGGKVRKMNLALQGGGSHGAFTWGVLHEFLTEPLLEIEGIGGTSAGAMNAVVYSAGIARGGRQGAIDALGRFWGMVAEAAAWSPFRRGPADILRGTWDIDRSPFVALAGLAGRLASPYQTNPFDHSPLRAALEGAVDMDAVRSSPVKVFLSATDVETGRARVFGREGMTLDMVLASACLPSMFQAVEIGGSHYWDGGFTGNPSLYPMIDGCLSGDIAVVQINPLVRRGVPRTPTEIGNRMTELSFNSSLTAEMRAIATIDKLLASGKLPDGGHPALPQDPGAPDPRRGGDDPSRRGLETQCRGAVPRLSPPSRAGDGTGMDHGTRAFGGCQVYGGHRRGLPLTAG